MLTTLLLDSTRPRDAMQYLMSAYQDCCVVSQHSMRLAKYALPCLSVEKHSRPLNEALALNLGIAFGIATRPYWQLQISKAQTAMLE